MFSFSFFFISFTVPDQRYAKWSCVKRKRYNSHELICINIKVTSWNRWASKWALNVSISCFDRDNKTLVADKNILLRLFFSFYSFFKRYRLRRQFYWHRGSKSASTQTSFFHINCTLWFNANYFPLAPASRRPKKKRKKNEWLKIKKNFDAVKWNAWKRYEYVIRSAFFHGFWVLS